MSVRDTIHGPYDPHRTDNEVTLVSGVTPVSTLSKASKADIAAGVLDAVEQLLG